MVDVQLHKLSNSGRQSKKRLGRGTGSGLGTTAGRGTKGQNSRSGGGVRPRFEGGHTPLYRLLPKLRGFKSQFNKMAIVNIEELDRHFKDGDIVSVKHLIRAGLAQKGTPGLKILGEGELTKKLTVYAERASAQAKNKIEKAGGKIVVASHVQKNTPSA